jgi:PKD repeat protein
MKIFLTVLFCLLLSPAAIATTYYVRTDGGSLSQCTGLGNAPYPGSGTGQNCAWHHPFDALPPQGDGANPAVSLHGGDTLIVGAGSYEMGANAPGASAYPACNTNWSWDCFMASVPSGTASQPTRILGAGWDQGCKAPPELWGSEHSAQVIALNGSSNVTIGCLEITDHSSCIESHLGGNSPLACNRSTPPFGPWASRGVYAKDAANVTLQDLNIHGMANRGILAGRLSNWTVNRVKIIANGWGGWDGDLADSGGSSDSGQMLFQSVEVGFNGCGESYPDKQIIGCWGQQEGGYGDGLGTTTTGGNWVFENSYFHHNTQDGLDLLYANTTATITVRQSHAEGNAGNQMKLAGSPTVQDSVIVGNCSYFQGKYNMSGDNSGGANTAGDLCRAMGNALVLSVQPTLKALVQYNTIASEGDCLILAINGDASSSVAIQNNALIGKPDWVKANESPQPQSCLFYWDSGPATWPVTYTGNLVWQTKNNTCPPGTGNRCNADPQLTDASLSSFNALPLPTSPLIDAASTSVPILATDFLGLPRPALNGYDIGAVEFQSATSGGGTIPNQPPIAIASATITAGVAPLAVSFNGSGSSDPDGSIASYAWTFGDGSTASGAATAHTYTVAGTYSAKLTVTDNGGATASQTLTISVSANNTTIVAPSSLSASSGKRGTVTLHWTDNGTGAQGIYVERAPASGGTFVRIGQTSATSTTYTQAGIDAGSYLYRVQAYTVTSTSAYSNSVDVRIK